MKRIPIVVILVALFGVWITQNVFQTDAQSQYPLPSGLVYPFSDVDSWGILSGYNNGDRHGGSATDPDDWRFYAYYGFDFAQIDGTSAGEIVYAPADIYYYRVQNSAENCIDAAIGSFTSDWDFYIEICHINFYQQYNSNRGNLSLQSISKGTPIGTVGNVGDCPSCSTPHIHIAAFLAPENSPWDVTGWCYTGGENLGWCRIPIAFQQFANYSLTIGGNNYPPLESNLFQISNQYKNPTLALSGSGGGSSEGSGSSNGNDYVDFREHTNYQGGQYGNSADPRSLINLTGWSNDVMSSIEVDSGYSTLVFTHNDAQGGRRCIVGSIPDLQYVTLDDGSNANDALSSFIWYDNSTCDSQYSANVAYGDFVTIYEHINYGGTLYGWHDSGNVFNCQGFWCNEAGSIAILHGKSVLAFDGQNGQGGAMCFSLSDSDLRDNNFDNGQPMQNNIESWKIFNNTSCDNWAPVVPIITTGGLPVEIGSNVTVGWYDLTPSGNDVIGMFDIYAADSSPISTQVVTASDGDLPFTVPTVVGVYNFRLIRNGLKVATSNPVNVVETPAPTNTPGPTPTPYPTGSGTGLLGQYYNGMSFESLALTRVDSVINFDWSNLSPDPSVNADQFSVTWTGFVEPRYTEDYVFCTSTDDGNDLRIGSTPLISQWIDQGETQVCSSPISLVAGTQYAVLMRYYESGGGAIARLKWQSANQPLEVIPQSQLYPADPPVIPQVTSLVLVNADTEVDIVTMYEGMLIDVASLGTNNFSIRAEAVNEESVVFGLDGNPSYSTESTEPYAINGDNGPSDYYAWTPATGSHYVSVTAYSQDGGTGTQSEALSYNFIVYDSAAVNLVSNPSFETVSGSFPDNWSTQSGLITLDQSSNGNDGTNSIHFAPTNDYITLVSGGFSVTAGQTYTFSFFVKSGSGNGSFGLRADFSDENWSYVSSDNIGTVGADVNGIATYTYTIPAGVAHMSLQFYSNAGTQFDVYIDSVVVQ